MTTNALPQAYDDRMTPDAKLSRALQVNLKNFYAALTLIEKVVDSRT